MGVKVTVGPPVLTINKSSTFLVSDLNGEIDARDSLGLFTGDTRFLSGYTLWVNGQRWERISSACTSHDAARICLTNPRVTTYTGDTALDPDTLALSIYRVLDGGLHETLFLTNYGLKAAEVVLEIELRSDFADLFEVRRNRLHHRANIVTEWHPDVPELITRYQREDYCCAFRYQIAGGQPSYANGRLVFSIQLRPGTSWQACGHMVLEHGDNVLKPRCWPVQGEDETAELRDRWIGQCMRVDSPNPDLNGAYGQSVEDMAALRLFEHDLAEDVWVPSAGVPWYVTLFGRDSLVAALQNMPVHGRFAEGALRTLANYQARERDDWRDAQPGKIVHEVRHGELAHFGEVPHTKYYGTWDATPLFLIVLQQAWRWLGDRQLIQDMLPAAERCLEWIDEFGDVDDDGFQEYQSFSSRGYENMGWKDAEDAIVYPDGTQVKQPKALCELQGYVYAAKVAAAELLRAFGDSDRATALAEEAADLKRRFNQAFWRSDEGFYALGLDGHKRPIRTVASNPGHCLWSGIVDDDKAELVVLRLLGGDMWSGWGIRTLSAVNPAYNPFSYQLGSVWPHDNSIIAAGMKRYGFARHANKVAKGVLDAASYFQSYRLPELFAGVARQTNSFPMQYRGANSPQAWAAGSVFQFLQTMLGLDADAPHGRLLVNPTLPDWLPWVELRGLRVGDVHLDLRFWREDEAEGSRFEVLQQSGPLEVVPA